MRALYKKLLEYNYQIYCENIKSNSFYSINEQKELCNYYDFIWTKYKQYSYPKFNYQIEQKFLYEGLIFSCNALTTSKAIKRKFPYIQIIPLESENIELKIKEEFYDINFSDALQNLLNVYGYFINRKEDYIHPISKTNYLILIIEPKFNNIEYTTKLKRKFLYHITTKLKLQKILKYGLIPKSLSKRAYHPDRIYLLTDNNHKTIQLMSAELYPNKEDGSTVLLTIDLSKHPFPIKLYKDSECAIEGVYTLENISPDCIINVKLI